MFPWMRAAALASAILVALALVSTGNPSRDIRLAAALGQAVESPATDDAAGGIVVPPGQEQLLGQLLGLGATLPGQCQFDNGDANGPIIHATYKCGDSEVVFELHHPSAAPAAAPRTAQFALVLRSGTPPPGLSDALLSLLRAREAEFHWLVIEPPAQPARAGRLWVPVVGVLGLAALGWATWRRRSARRAPT
jgi:hypothetical protein